MPSTETPDTYDGLFIKYGAPYKIPVAFLRTLAYYESQMNPKCVNMPSMGLMQIHSKLTLKDYNTLCQKNVKPADLLDPNVSVRIACWHLGRIIKTYKKAAPDLLATDWAKPAFVMFLALGWTAGWTAESGVPSIVTKMRQGGISDDKITLDTVIQTAQHLHPHSYIYAKPSPGPYMSNPALRNWVLKVTAKYLKTLGSVPLEAGVNTPSHGIEKAAVIALGFVAAAGIAIGVQKAMTGKTTQSALDKFRNLKTKALGRGA